MRKVLTDLRNHRVIRHPRPTGVLRVVRVPLREGLRILGIDEIKVISLAQRQLRGPANIPGNNTNPDQIHDVEDVHPGQVLPGPAFEQAADLLVQLPQRLWTRGGATERLDRRTFRPDVPVVELRERLTRL